MYQPMTTLVRILGLEVEGLKERWTIRTLKEVRITTITKPISILVHLQVVGRKKMSLPSNITI